MQPTLSFKQNIEKIRARARERMADGAITEANRVNRDQLVNVLNEVLATELVCMLRYKNHFFVATGINAETVATEFEEHAAEELRHADMIARRITQLGGVPNLAPEGLADRSHARYVSPADLEGMIREDLVAERVAIEVYSDIVRWLGDDDPTTRRIMEEVLAAEEEHADDLANLLATKI